MNESSGDASAMTLREHLSELRTRLTRSALGILLATIFVWNHYQKIFGILRKPYDDIHQQNPDSILALTGVTSGLALQVRIAVVGGIIISSPVWLYQLWRYVSPGLHKNERNWAYLFSGITVPLFFSGCWLGYAVLPRTLHALYSFTPKDVVNVTNIDTYISFTLHLTLFFGLGFVLPVLLVMLNFAGILSASRVWKSWRWIVVGSFVFGAIATPNGDPIGMTIIALPVMLLTIIAALVATVNDRRRDKFPTGTNQWADSEASPLDVP